MPATSFAPVFPIDDSPPGIYIHVPFCVSRCAYCAFVTERYHPEREERFVRAAIREIGLRGRNQPRSGEPAPGAPDTLYFGGGTPSLLHAESIERLSTACRRVFDLAPDAEVTMEMNPATVNRTDLIRFRRAGVNRASLGVQSLDDRELAAMGRPHTARDALDALRDLRDAGFDNVSVDVIVGFPEQTARSLDRTLSTLLEHDPEHLSAYLLELKEGSRLTAEIAAGRTAPPDDDLAADLYEQLCRAAAESGLEQYEIANFARPGRTARHNVKYWADGTWIGIGPGAHGMTGRDRYVNHETVAKYEASLEDGTMPEASRTALSPAVRFRDALIMGLRLTEGLDLDRIGSRYGVDAHGFVRETVGDLENAELLVMNQRRIMLTDRGRLLSNVVFSRWV
jgi:oxygen-independent coproporphyrinogen III oxidase